MQAVTDQTGVYNSLGMYVQPVVQNLGCFYEASAQLLSLSVLFIFFITGVGEKNI